MLQSELTDETDPVDKEKNGSICLIIFLHSVSLIHVYICCIVSDNFKRVCRLNLLTRGLPHPKSPAKPPTGPSAASTAIHIEHQHSPLHHNLTTPLAAASLDAMDDCSPMSTLARAHNRALRQPFTPIISRATSHDASHEEKKTEPSHLPPRPPHLAPLSRVTMALTSSESTRYDDRLVQSLSHTPRSTRSGDDSTSAV